MLFILGNTLFGSFVHGENIFVSHNFLQGLFTALAVWLLVKAAAGLACGWGLLQHEPWARNLHHLGLALPASRARLSRPPPRRVIPPLLGHPERSEGSASRFPTPHSLLTNHQKLITNCAFVAQLFLFTLSRRRGCALHPPHAFCSSELQLRYNRPSSRTVIPSGVARFFPSFAKRTPGNEVEGSSQPFGTNLGRSARRPRHSEPRRTLPV